MGFPVFMTEKTDCGLAFLFTYHSLQHSVCPLKICYLIFESPSTGGELKNFGVHYKYICRYSISYQLWLSAKATVCNFF